MAKHYEYFVEPRTDGSWNVKKPHAERASAITNTQKQAIAQAKLFASEGDIKIRDLTGNTGRVDRSGRECDGQKFGQSGLRRCAQIDVGSDNWVVRSRGWNGHKI